MNEFLTDFPACPPMILAAITSPSTAERPNGRRSIEKGERNDYLFRVGSAMRGRGLSGHEIRAELKKVKVKVALAFGRRACDALVPGFRSITREQGKACWGYDEAYSIAAKCSEYIIQT